MLVALIIVGIISIGLLLINIILVEHTVELENRLDDEIRLNEKLMRRITGVR